MSFLEQRAGIGNGVLPEHVAGNEKVSLIPGDALIWFTGLNVSEYEFKALSKGNSMPGPIDPGEEVPELENSRVIYLPINSGFVLGPTTGAGGQKRFHVKVASIRRAHEDRRARSIAVFTGLNAEWSTGNNGEQRFEVYGGSTLRRTIPPVNSTSKEFELFRPVYGVPFAIRTLFVTSGNHGDFTPYTRSSWSDA